MKGSRFLADRQTDWQTDGRTDGRTDRQTDGRTEGKHIVPSGVNTGWGLITCIYLFLFIKCNLGNHLHVFLIALKRRCVRTRKLMVTKYAFIPFFVSCKSITTFLYEISHCPWIYFEFRSVQVSCRSDVLCSDYGLFVML